MSTFRQHFQNAHVVLPVIHAINLHQVRTNAERAMEAGADGVWLINHHQHVHGGKLVEWAEALVAIHPSLWVGINRLDEPARAAFGRLSSAVKGVWTDNAHIDERASGREQRAATGILSARERAGFSGVYFGGFAFKGQRMVADLEAGAKLATSFMDVVTTSGPQTGTAPSTEKVRAIREAIGDFPLAVASGISPENVHLFLPYVDAFLVASSIIQQRSDLELFDTARLRVLVRAVRSYHG